MQNIVPRINPKIFLCITRNLLLNKHEKPQTHSAEVRG